MKITAHCIRVCLPQKTEKKKQETHLCLEIICSFIAPVYESKQITAIKCAAVPLHVLFISFYFIQNGSIIFLYLSDFDFSNLFVLSPCSFFCFLIYIYCRLIIIIGLPTTNHILPVWTHKLLPFQSIKRCTKASIFRFYADEVAGSIVFYFECVRSIRRECHSIELCAGKKDLRPLHLRVDFVSLICVVCVHSV